MSHLDTKNHYYVNESNFIAVRNLHSISQPCDFREGITGYFYCPLQLLPLHDLLANQSLDKVRGYCFSCKNAFVMCSLACLTSNDQLCAARSHSRAILCSAHILSGVLNRARLKSNLMWGQMVSAYLKDQSHTPSDITHLYSFDGS